MLKCAPLFVLAFFLALASADWDCKVVSNKMASHYDLSSKAREAIDFPSGQSVNGFKAVECTCSGSVKMGTNLVCSKV